MIAVYTFRIWQASTWRCCAEDDPGKAMVENNLKGMSAVKTVAVFCILAKTSRPSADSTSKIHHVPSTILWCCCSCRRCVGCRHCAELHNLAPCPRPWLCTSPRGGLQCNSRAPPFVWASVLIPPQEAEGYYNFSNIRYAAPPVGDLRFRAPKPPAVDRTMIQDGSESRMCPQNYPPWMASIGWVPDYIQSSIVPNTTTGAGTSANSSSAPSRDPMQNEDCLFLDVMVPGAIFESAGRGPGAPVLVWIYGKKTTREACVDVLTKPRSRWWLRCGLQDQWIRSKKPYPPESD